MLVSNPGGSVCVLVPMFRGLTGSTSLTMVGAGPGVGQPAKVILMLLLLAEGGVIPSSLHLTVLSAMAGPRYPSNRGSRSGLTDFVPSARDLLGTFAFSLFVRPFVIQLVQLWFS